MLTCKATHLAQVATASHLDSGMAVTAPDVIIASFGADSIEFRTTSIFRTWETFCTC